MTLCTYQVQRVEVDVLEGVVVEGGLEETVVGTVGDAGEGSGRSREKVSVAARQRGRGRRGKSRMVADLPEIGEDGGDVLGPAPLYARAGRGGSQVVVVDLSLPRF